MAAVTVSGTVGGTPISVLTNGALQQALAQSILASTTAAGLVTGSGGSLTTTYTTDISLTGSILTGPAPGGSAQVLLNGQFGTFITGVGSPPTPSTSIVVAADNSNSSVVNINPFGGLIAQTGAGGNVLLGLAGQNNFFTGAGGSDVVILNGASNTLTSHGADAVLVGGPSTVTAAGNGFDNILVTSGTNLAFINGTTIPGAVDSVSGAANSAITLAGTGATSIASGAGPEAFYVDTGAGKVTLNGNLQTNDALTLLKDAATTPGTAAVTVNNFAGSAVNVHGYSGVEFTIGAAATGGSVLSLTDGSTVTFTNLTTAQLTAITKTV